MQRGAGEGHGGRRWGSSPSSFSLREPLNFLTSGSSSHLGGERHPSSGAPTAIRSKGESRRAPWGAQPFLSRSQATVAVVVQPRVGAPVNTKGRLGNKEPGGGKQPLGPGEPAHPQPLTPGPLEMGPAHSPEGKEPPPSCPISPRWAFWYPGPSPPSTSQPQQKGGGRWGVRRLLG